MTPAPTVEAELAEALRAIRRFMIRTGKPGDAPHALRVAVDCECEVVEAAIHALASKPAPEGDGRAAFGLEERNKVIEECAKVADSIEDDLAMEWRAGLKGSSYLEGKSDGAGDVAIAIRALSKQSGTP